MYRIELKSRAIRDLHGLSRQDAMRILGKIKDLECGLVGDIKKLTNFTPEYRMRIGNYRVLFEIEGDKIIIYRINHRKEACNQR